MALNFKLPCFGSGDYLVEQRWSLAQNPHPLVLLGFCR